MELEVLNKITPEIKAQGASLVVISPQLEKFSKLMVKKLQLTFPLLRDENNQVASQFGIAFQLPDDLLGLYGQFGIDLVKYNENDQNALPMPGRFVVDQKGHVVSAEANPDYTRRPEPTEMIEVLKNMN